MRPPARIRVGDVVFTVVLAPVDSGDAGTTNVLQQGIKIEVDQGSDQMRDTVLHEVLHAIWAGAGLLSNKDANEHQEAVIGALTPLLLDTLRRNPRLRTYLFSR